MHFNQLYLIEQSFGGIVEFEKTHGLNKTLNYYDGFCKGETQRKRKLQNFLRDHDIMFRSKYEYQHDSDQTNMAEMALLHGPKAALRIYNDFCPGDKNRYRKVRALMKTVGSVSPHEHILLNANTSGNKAALASHKHFHFGDPNRGRKLRGMLKKIEQGFCVDATWLCEQTSEYTYDSPFGCHRAKRNKKSSSVATSALVDAGEEDSGNLNILSLLEE